MQKSVYTKILKGEIPGEVIYQDDKSAVLLTIEPLNPGHMLVIPKVEIDHIWDVDDETYRHLWDVAKTMAKKLKAIYGYERVATLVEGFGVPHAHIHVFGIDKHIDTIIVQDGELKLQTEKKFATPEELASEAAKLRAT